MTSNPSPDARPDDRPVLVLAPDGATGRRVADRLRSRGVGVRARSRRTTPAFSWQQPTTWDGALEGARGVYLVYSPDLMVPGAVDEVAGLAARARALGVPRTVLLSGRGEAAAQEAERRAREHLPGLTCVRSAWFWQNFTEGAFAPMVDDGVLALPVGSVAEPFVDCGDVADVVVAALLGDGGAHEGRTYEVTGPRSLTFAEAAQVLSRQRRTPVRLEPVTLSQARAAWEAAQVPAPTRWLLGELFGTVLDGRSSAPGAGVRQALGRPPRDVADVAVLDGVR